MENNVTDKIRRGHRNQKLADFLYNETYAETKIFRVSNLSGSYEDWGAAPVDSEILSSSPEIGSNDYFVVKAFLIKNKDEVDECYVDILLPERISESVFQLINGELVEKKKWEIDAEVVPQVSVNFFGDYELFYSRKIPDLGISILKNGLTLVENKFAIAVDLAYILRDEGENEDSIEAFSTAINEDSTNYFLFVERAQLFEKMGNKRLADADWEFVSRLAGNEVLKMYRNEV